MGAKFTLRIAQKSSSHLAALPSNRNVHTVLDKIGAGMSLACAIHCLLMPLLIGILPLLGLGFLADHTAEIIFVGFSIVLALTSLCWGYRTHRSKYVFLLLACATGLIVTGIWIVAENHHLYFVVAGALCISASHIVNQRLCASCTSCDHTAHACCAKASK